MSPKRPTGTVPKAKVPRTKNAVPQEMVAPTRRDLQQHLNDFFASVQRASKRDNNNRTPGEGTCFELDNFSLPENTSRSCWPVRPIPRRNFLHDISNGGTDQSHAGGTGGAGTSLSANAAIGVVIPTTPNSTLHQQQNQLNEQLLQQNQHLLMHRVPDGAPQPTRNFTAVNNTNNNHPVAINGDNGSAANVEERLSQIQDYIRITTTLIDSINNEKTNGPRPQSVSSIHTTTPNTPTYEELQSKLEASNRNIMHIKEQQQQLLRLQQAAKNQLYEMEQVRGQQAPMTFTGSTSDSNNGAPDYDNVDDVAQDVTALMSRMKNLTDFINGQSDLASTLGMDEKSELLEEQVQLQKKLAELKNKKQQMANLVNELQSMQSENNFDEANENNRSQETPTRNLMSDEYPMVPLEYLQNSRAQAMNSQAQPSIPRYGNAASTGAITKNINDREMLPQAAKFIRDDRYGDGAAIGIAQPTTASINGTEEDDDDEVAAVAIEHDNILQDKIAQINAMKDQLKRLQDMMHTVKLIEIKNGDYNPDDEQAQFNEKSDSDLQNNMQSSDDPQRDEEEQEMAERVRALHSMTNDLRQQAVSLAAERDRLKDIKNEMARRRDLDATEKNVKQQSSVANSQKEQELEAEYVQKKKEFQNLCEKLDGGGESRRSKKESASQLPSTAGDGGFYSPNNWPNASRHNISSTSSLRSSHGGGGNQSDNISNKPIVPNCNQGKDSADSGAADVLNMSVEAGSLQSGSSRGFSVPPMRNITAKSSQEISRLSSINNQTNTGYENQTEQHSPWYWYNYNQPYGSVAPQSPHCHYNHHLGGSEQHYCRPMCMPQIAPGMSNDPMLMQQFIQTQQMLINSMSQCNQLLWDQQREINNLNSAVLLIQERLLNSSAIVDPNQSNMLRAESVPPNVVCTNQAPFLPRAQSEQPQHFGTANFPPSSGSATSGAVPQQHTSPFRQYSNQTCQNAQFYRNANQQPGQRLLRQSLLNSRTGIGAPFYESDPTQQLHYSNNFLNAQHLSNHTINENANNDVQSPLPTINNAQQQQQQQQASPIFMHHNNNTSATTPTYSTTPNNANNINNLHHHQNLLNATNRSATPITNNNANATNSVSRVFSPSVSQPSALNNQKTPGNRANNYWDNFRSYSRQNLLSTTSSKSNELEQQQQQQQQQQQNQTTLAIGNKFRNQINQNTPTPDVLNVTASNGNQSTVTNSIIANNHLLSTLNTSGGNDSNLLNSVVNNHNNNHNNSTLMNINSYNLDLNELKQPKIATKTMQKGSTGGSKRVRPLRDISAPSNERENNVGLAAATIAAPNSVLHDLNLATSSNQRNSKSSSKLFDDIYLEVSALIAANESRPHFLINLFRELQLISTSDPLRTRLMQAFQEVYTTQCEANANILPDMHPALPLNVAAHQIPAAMIQNDLENPHHDSVHSSEPHFNDRSTGYASVVGTATCVPDLQSSIDEGLLQPIMQDIRELLHHYQDAGNEISDTVIQRIASIIFRHLNQSPAGSSASSENGSQSYKESFDEILVNVRQLDRRGRGSFMEKLENYISCVLDSAGTVPNQDTNNFNCRPDNECTYLDLTAKQDTFSGNAAGKPNDLLLTLRKKEHSNVPVAASPILADVVAVGHVLPTQISEGNSQVVAPFQSHKQSKISVSGPAPLSHSTPTHQSSNNNQDLAEADQICQNGAEAAGSSASVATVSPDINACDVELPENEISGEIGAGAVGGLSQLPDLAKVSTNSSRDDSCFDS